MMKNLFIRAAAAVLCAMCLCIAVPQAAAAQTVAVILDGTPVSFANGVAPVTKNGRTYVPFRAIFEAMGATVAWDQKTNTVSALRDGTSVAFQIGQKNVTVTEAGEKRTASTDASSFIQNGNTFVPVRFAAQAFGADVGWDNHRKTVLIVDAAKMGQAYADNFSVMDKYLTFAMPAQSRVLSGEIKLLYTVHTASGDIQIPMTLSFGGTQDLSSAHFSVKTVTDIAAMAQALSTAEDAVPESVADLLTTLQNASYELIVSRPDGAVYLKGNTFSELSVPENAWVRLPMDSALPLLSGNRLNEAALAGIARHRFGAYAAGAAATVKLTDAAADNVGAVRAAIERLSAQYSDDKFVQNENQLEAVTETVTADGAQERNVLRLTIQDDAVTGAQTERTVTKNGAIVLQSQFTQDISGSMNGTVTVDSASYRANVTFAMTCATAENEPLRRPAGTILPK